MAFVKAYMQVFTSESFLLIIEEPEAHLHPLAQKWLKEYIAEMCQSGIQVMISTHSTAFIDANYIDSLVRVHKVGGTTEAIQLSKQDLYDFCVASGVSKNKTSPDNIVDFYSTKLFPDQLQGVFAETILLVEGPTEYHALPIYLKKNDFSLAEHGVEIIDCRGKSSIPLFWRLFRAYGYNCFAVFDGDSNPNASEATFQGLIEEAQWQTGEKDYCISDNYAYFGKDYESYFRSAVPQYKEIESVVAEKYQITSKPGKAKAVAQHCQAIPEFITDLSERLSIMELLG